MTDSGGTAEEPEQPDQAPPGYPRPPATPPTQVLPEYAVPGQATSPEPPGQAGWVPPPPPPPPPPPVPPPSWPPPPGQPPVGWPAAAAPQPAAAPPLTGPPPPPPSAPAAGWAQPGPSYAPAGYQAAPSWAPGPPGPPGPVARRRNLSDLAAGPPHLLASVAISVGIVVLFVANLLIALGLPTGTAGNIRLLQLVSPADLAVGAILMVAVALVTVFRAATTAATAAGTTIPGPAPAGAVLRHDNVRMLAGFVALGVATCAAVRAIVVLTIGHQHAAVKLGNMIDALAAVLVASVAAYWALKHRDR